jgi:hypothetical protein
MIQCKDCEFFFRDESGQMMLKCDPFSTIKEPECLAKWQLVKTTQLAEIYQATLDYYRKLGPLQKKMFKIIEREVDDIEEADSWKLAGDDEEPPEDPPDNPW